MTIRAVLFDAAGTLIELAESVGETYARIAERFGVALPASRLDDAFRRVWASAPPMVFPDAAPEAVPALERGWWREVVRSTFRAADSTVRFDDFDAFFAALYDVYSGAPAWRPRPGARQALGALRAAGLAVGVVSNFDHRLDKILEAMGMTELLDFVGTPSRCGSRKPERVPFAAALDALGVPAASAVFVGDDPAMDLAAARAAGLSALDVHQLDSLCELPDVIATLDDSPEEAPTP
ncbi:MAG: HAD-IA family hydrolase [Proteobacteria bacterium]|nr:HAD-IA family hydrolase [Pseudomonadota bacterium]